MTWVEFDQLKTLIEVPAFLSLFSVMVQIPVFTNLVLYRTCYVTLGYNESDCALLGTGHKDNFTNNLTQLVEPDANNLNLYIQLPAGFICSFMGLYVGTWSDRNGRKPLLLSTLGAQALGFAMTAVFCLLPNLSPWYLILTVLPTLATGGFAAMLTLYLSYITDISDEHSRGTRLGSFEITFALGSLLGTLASSYIFQRIGYAGVYLVSTGFLMTSFCFTLFILKESLSESRKEVLNQEREQSFTEQLKSMTECALKKRPHYERALILLCLVITSLFVFALISDVGIIYLFLQVKFGWSLEKFTVFSSTRDFLSIVGTFFGIYGLHKKLDVNETVLILVGLISCFSSSLVQGLANADIHIYFAGALRFLSGCVNPMVRSLISKIARPDEIGKIFSVAVMCQSILQLVGSPLYTKIYNDSLSTWPSFYNFVTAGVYFFALILTIILIIVRLKSTREPRFQVLEEDATSEIFNDENDNA
ncbi:proton-coupled folate transporter-like [Coccinella septempunctata]|uniref:proton-coupled folate transporter-like n=1 Tax=Coccinella septempunctata TaxID=41139 RepID=UPI001D08C76F|nr:proton-coupled folate transporter-like [Coccinella septempunctata]XP_044746557.1 proton-coupled folate transporter-like [Coccinella septempunctata]